MVIDEIRRGIVLTVPRVYLKSEVVELLSDAVSRQAIYDLEGRHALALDEESGKIVYFSLFKAVTAVAGVLGTVLSIGAPLAVPAVLSAIGALGALSGLSEKLPDASARIVLLLLEREDREMPHEDLKDSFGAVYDGPRGEMDADFGQGLDQLKNIKGVRIDHGRARLVDRVFIRL